MKTSTLLLGVSAAMMLAACASEDRIERIDRDAIIADLTPIRVAARAANIESTTRTPWIGDQTTISSSKKLDAYVLASLTSGDYSTLYEDVLLDHANRIIWSSSEATGFSNAAGAAAEYYYPLEEQIYLVGLYPYTSSTTGGGWEQSAAGTPKATSTIKGTFDGKTDLMFAPQKSANKDKSPTLEFAHLGTLLNIYLYAEDDHAINEWGTISDITLTNISTGIKSTVTVGLADGSTTQGTTVNSLPLYGVSNNTTPNYTDVTYTGKAYELTTTAAIQAYGIFPPVTTDGATGTAEYTLTINSSEVAGKVVPLQLETTQAVSTKGKSYKVSLKFKMAGEVGIDVAITAWNEGTAITQDVDVEATPSVTPLSGTNLSANGTANSYIINTNASQAYYFDAQSMGNGVVPASQAGNLTGTITPNENYTAKILWSMGGANGKNGIISTPVYDATHGAITFNSTATNNNGNALVALVDTKGTSSDTSDDEILWSWHLWRTNYDPSNDYHLYDVVDGRTIVPSLSSGKEANQAYTRFMVNEENGVPGMKVMKYDLGDVNNGNITVLDETNGFFYTWGRKDPFWGVFSNSLNFGGSSFVLGGITDVASTIQKPTNFSSSNPLFVTDFNDDLWGDPGASAPRLATSSSTGNTNTFPIAMNPKTCFDPCPPGWRVPPAETFKIFDTYNPGNTTAAKGTYTASFVVNDAGDIAAFVTHGGQLSYNNFTMNSNGGYWTSGAIDDVSWTSNKFEFYFALDPGGNYPKMYNDTSGYAHRIRCAQE
ncbi:MAG: fimbrillin family protein [Mediterranea sp.]|jgi:hypothetical protein|nr:fimbrillin family protein [Mediterranea sp.]